MSKFTIIDGDFAKQDFAVQSTLISLEDLDGRQRTYYVDADLTPVKIKALKKNEVTVLVTFKDGKKFTAQADMAAYKEFMTKAGQPVMSETKAVTILVISMIVIGFFLKSCIGGDDIQRATTSSNNQAQITQNALAPDVEYFAILESEIININNTDINSIVKDGPGVLAGSRVSIIVLDVSVVDGSILNTVQNVRYIPSVGLISIIDSQKGDYSNLAIAYMLARDLAMNAHPVDLDKDLLGVIINRIIKDISEVLSIKNLVLNNIDTNKKILAQLEKSVLLMEFNQKYLLKFLADGQMSKADFLDFYSGDDVRERYKLIEKEIKEI